MGLQKLLLQGDAILENNKLIRAYLQPPKSTFLPAELRLNSVME